MSATPTPHRGALPQAVRALFARRPARSRRTPAEPLRARPYRAVPPMDRPPVRIF